MLQKNYSFTVVGKGYLSFLYGIELLRRDLSILILDDRRLEYGDLFTFGLSKLDIEFLKTWGTDRNITALKQIEDFVTQRSLTYVLGGKRVLLGGKPWNNLRELYRKFPNLFNYPHLFDKGNDGKVESESIRKRLSEDLNQLYSNLGADGFRFKTIENNSIEYLLGQTPDSIKELFFTFQNSLKEKRREGWCFLYFIGSLYHKSLSSSYSEPEIYHLFLSLLSPHYALDEPRLCKRLSQVFTERGGHFKETQVREWKFYRRMPWSIELASFEGIIHPKRLCFLGSHPRGLPLKVKYDQKMFLSVHFKAKIDKKAAEAWKDQLVISGSPNALATDIPLWRLEVRGDEVFGQYLYREKLGSKLKFFESFLKERLIENINQWSASFGESLSDEITFTQGPEVYLDQSYTYFSSPLPKVKEVKLYDFSTPFLKSKLKNVNYFGPLKGLPLGLYGQLLEIKEVSKYQ